MMQQGYGVQLPQSTRAKPVNAEPINVAVPLSFGKDQTVLLDGARVRLSFLAERIRQAVEGRTSPDVYLRADGQLPYQAVVTVMDELKAGGVRNVMQLTAPSNGRAR